MDRSNQAKTTVYTLLLYISDHLNTITADRPDYIITDTPTKSSPFWYIALVYIITLLLLENLGMAGYLSIFKFGVSRVSERGGKKLYCVRRCQAGRVLRLIKMTPNRSGKAIEILINDLGIEF